MTQRLPLPRSSACMSNWQHVGNATELQICSLLCQVHPPQCRPRQYCRKLRLIGELSRPSGSPPKRIVCFSRLKQKLSSKRGTPKLGSFEFPLQSPLKAPQKLNPSALHVVHARGCQFRQTRKLCTRLLPPPKARRQGPPREHGPTETFPLIGANNDSLLPCSLSLAFKSPILILMT